MDTALQARRAPTADRPRRAGRRAAWALAPLALGAAALTACGGPYGSVSAATGSAPAPGATGAVVTTASTSLGTILVDGTGRTVYDFANDTGTASTCNGSCAAVWHPVVSPATLPTPPAGVTGRLGSTTRSDGSSQLTVAGHPVYTFTGDGGPGETKGQGVRLNGGLWTVVSPAGSPVTDTAPSSSSTY
jgi:predicted lipoprotein with Yx(FWY)xxD motif